MTWPFKRTTPNGRHLGGRRPTPDQRDHRFVARIEHDARWVIPQSVDLSPDMPPAFDQGQLGSCGPNAGAALLAYLHPGFIGSRLQIYYNVRAAEGTLDQDAGVQTRDVLKALAKWGAGPEDAWRYDINRFADAPSPEAIAAADQHKIDSYAQLSSENDMLSCLAEGLPFLLGFQVPDYFDAPDIASNGIFTLPGARNPRWLGGHDVLAVGYDLNFKANPDFLASKVDPVSVQDTAFKIRNSWGPAWGLAGHFWMPAGFAINPATGGDAWTGRLNASAVAPSGPSVGGVPITGHFV